MPYWFRKPPVILPMQTASPEVMRKEGETNPSKTPPPFPWSHYRVIPPPPQPSFLSYSSLWSHSCASQAANTAVGILLPWRMGNSQDRSTPGEGQIWRAGLAPGLGNGCHWNSKVHFIYPDFPTPLFLSVAIGGAAAIRAQSMEVGSCPFCQLPNLTLPGLTTSPLSPENQQMSVSLYR